MNSVWIFIKAGFLKHGMLLKFVYFIKHLRFLYNKEEENLPGPLILDNKTPSYGSHFHYRASWNGLGEVAANAMMSLQNPL